MLWKYIILQTLLASSAWSSSIIHPHHVRSESIAYRPCGIETASSAQCGNLTVPMDYTSTNSTATITLQLMKVPAVRTPKKGSILFNFGGPARGAQDDLVRNKDVLLALVSEQLTSTKTKLKMSHRLTGGEYDLIAHDPR
ncbi:uncharacterized protein BDV14DRAFT_162543 [Aspergillus stella-maris]|uniref:uncharacterized protein n=1 Tax=Aspergillus stella-maris TaxID=1810926 RepID=UPI003CCD82E2